MNDLTDVLRRALAERDAEAPGADAIRERMRGVEDVRRRPSWIVPLTVAATVLAVAGGLLMSRSVIPRPDRPPSDPTRPSLHRVTLYDAVRVPGHPRGWQLTPRSAQVRDTGDPAYDAVSALFTTRSTHEHFSWYRLRATPIARVRSVQVGGTAITVDLDRSVRDPYPGLGVGVPSGNTVGNPPVETLVQQLVWTAQDAARSELPVRLTVNGRPARWFDRARIPELLYPRGSEVAPSARTAGWYTRICSGLRITARTPDGTSVLPVRDGIRRAHLSLAVGDPLELKATGQCGNPVAGVLSTPGAPVSRNGQSLSFLATQPGRGRITLYRAWCPPLLFAGCTGGQDEVAVVRVDVRKP